MSAVLRRCEALRRAGRACLLGGALLGAGVGGALWPLAPAAGAAAAVACVTLGAIAAWGCRRVALRWLADDIARHLEAARQSVRSPGHPPAPGGDWPATGAERLGDHR